MQFAILFVAAASGAWMLSKRWAGIRELGILVITLTILWAAAITHAVPRWGILRSDAPLDLFARRTTYAIFFVLDVALVAVIVVVRRFASKEPTRS
jgi:hypothetical protein